MTFVFPRIFLRGLQPLSVGPQCFFSRHSFYGTFNARSLSRAFNSSLSCQPPLEESYVQSDGQTQEDQFQKHDKEIRCMRRLQALKMQSTVKEKEDEKGVPLKDVVAYCARHSFKDYLKKANDGDLDAQMIVGKMYCSGYGVNKDLQKGQEWMKKAQCKWKKKSIKQDLEDDELFFI